MLPKNEAIPPEAWQGLRRATTQFLLDPNVALIDLGWRIRDRQGGRVEPTLCVRVHMRQKLFGAAFEAFAAAAPERVPTEEKIGFPVDVPLATYLPHQGEPTAPRSYVFEPMQGGISVANLLLNGYGTLGGLVADRATGAPMILSNWHVLAGCGYAGENSPICQPGRGDGGHGGYVVGWLARHALDRQIDGAVARLSGARHLINNQLELGPVAGAAAPELGMRMVKSGRRTGITHGIVAGIGGRMAMWYGSAQHIIREIVHIVPAPGEPQLSAAGDSGSWWVDQASQRAVGLHFAGSDNPDYGLAIAMPAVLDALDVTIVAG